MTERAPHFLRFARALTHVSPRTMVPVIALSTLLGGCGGSSETAEGARTTPQDTAVAEGGGGISGDTSTDAPVFVDAGISTPPDSGDAAVADAGDAQDGETIPPGGPMAPPELPAGFLV